MAVYPLKYYLRGYLRQLASSSDLRTQEQRIDRRYVIDNVGLYGIESKSSNPFMGPLVVSTAIEDFRGELVHDFDQSVLWGAPIMSWLGDCQPIEIVHAMQTNAPRRGAGFRDWMRDNYTRILTNVISPWFKDLSPDNAHAETIC